MPARLQVCPRGRAGVVAVCGRLAAAAPPQRPPLALTPQMQRALAVAALCGAAIVAAAPAAAQDACAAAPWRSMPLASKPAALEQLDLGEWQAYIKSVVPHMVGPAVGTRSCCPAFPSLRTGLRLSCPPSPPPPSLTAAPSLRRCRAGARPDLASHVAGLALREDLLRLLLRLRARSTARGQGGPQAARRQAHALGQRPGRSDDSWSPGRQVRLGCRCWVGGQLGADGGGWLLTCGSYPKLTSSFTPYRRSVAGITQVKENFVDGGLSAIDTVTQFITEAVDAGQSTVAAAQALDAQLLSIKDDMVAMGPAAAPMVAPYISVGGWSGGVLVGGWWAESGTV